MSLFEAPWSGVSAPSGPTAIPGPDASRATDSASASTGIDSDNCLQWLMGAHDMLAATILHGTTSSAAPRYIEQYATASRTLIMIPARRPELSRAVDFSRIAHVASALKVFSWHEISRHVEVGNHEASRRYARLRAEYEGVRPRDAASSTMRRTTRCVTVTSLEWLQHSLKPRTLSFAVCHDEEGSALRDP
jgi:hypothetical protein